MSQQLINLGVLPNDGQGDPLRVAFDKINNNFSTLFSVTSELPNLIVVGSSANDGSGDTLRTAFDKLNKNFANLFTISGLTPVKFSVNDPLRTTFERVNSSFAKIYEILGSRIPVVEVISPTETTEPDLVSDASYVGNINITNYNFYVNKNEPAPQPTALPGPVKVNSPYNTPLGSVAYWNQEIINVGAAPNDGTGDPLRVAFQKINNNFSNLFFTTTLTDIAYTVGPTAGQIIYEIPTSQFTHGNFQIRSADVSSGNSQDITLSSQLSSNSAAVKFVGYGTTFSGNPVCRYDMDVAGGNVRVLINPLANLTIEHFIVSQVTWKGNSIPGLDIQLDGYGTGNILVTENGLSITTEGP